MSVIKISRSHNLDDDRAKALAEEVVVDLAEKFSVKYHWEEDTVRFKGAGARGYMSVQPQSVELKMELSFMLLPFKAKIENAICRHLDEFCC